MYWLVTGPYYTVHGPRRLLLSVAATSQPAQLVPQCCYRCCLAALPPPQLTDMGAVTSTGLGCAGDKIANKTAEVPKSFDYTYERGIAAVAVQLAKAAAPGGRSHRPICVLVGDDAELMANVRKQAERVLMCATVKAMEPAGSVAPFGKGSNSCSKLQRMLVDMDLIAWANYTVGTMWSNFDSVAYYAAICSYKRSQESYVDGSAMVFGPYI